MKSIVVCFSGTQFQDPPFDEPNWQRAYLDLGNAIEMAGGQLWIARHAVSYRGDMRFDGTWRVTNDQFIHREGIIVADLIVDKCRDFSATGTYHILNVPEVRALCEDKTVSIERLPHLYPKTVRVERKEELEHALNQVPSERVVRKPLTGSGGKGVLIGTAKEVQSADAVFPCLLQEFIDTGDGIPGITDTVHDYRMIVAGGEVILTFVRSPRRGSLLSNTSQGGFMIMVPPEVRPDGPETLLKEVDALLKDHPTRLYSIDCARNSDGTWKLIELNDQPGMMTRLECGPEADRYFSSLTSFLLRA